MAASQHKDSFLSSMTFAQQGCSCDECGDSAVPQEVREAVQAHLKRRKLEQGSNVDTPLFGVSVNITQRRQLTGRFGGVSVWKLVLPPSVGDPIVEYRNSHRIVFVRRLPKKCSISSIGRGIIGSASEESDRKPTNWKEGKAYLLPVRKGVACGWICKSHDKDEVNDSDANSGAERSDEEGTEMAGEATLYIFKATDSELEEDENAPSWAKRTSEQFARSIRALDKNSGRSESNLDTSEGTQGIPLSDEDCAEIGRVVEEVVGSEAAASPS